MAILENISHVRGETMDTMRYIQNPEKTIYNDESANVLRYMQGHAVEDMMSVGYNGCSGDRDLAVQQFRLAEEAYKAIHPARKKQVTRITVEQYLEANHKKRLPRHIKPDADGMITIEKTEVTAEHLVLSLHKLDKASPSLLQAVIDDFMTHKYLRGYYALSNIHWNTDEAHAHILISNYEKTGHRKLSLSGTKLRELQRHLDRICVKYGLSIVDSREARLDPEHAAWIDQVKAEGKVKVWPGQSRGQRSWKAADKRAKAEKIERIEKGTLPPAAKEAYKAEVLSDGFTGDGVYLRMIRRARLREDARKAKLRDDELKRSFYRLSAREKYYDPNLKDHILLTNLIMIYLLAKIAIEGDVDFLETYYPAKAQELEADFGKPDYAIQNMINSITTAHDMNARTPEDLMQRAKEIGQLIGETRRAIAYDKKTLERTDLVEAVKMWDDKQAPDEARKAAYAVLASYGCNDYAKRSDLAQRIRRAERRLFDNKKYLNDLGRDYNRIQKAIGTLQNVRASVERYNDAAIYEARQHPLSDVDARIAESRRKAELEETKRRERKREKEEPSR